LLELILDFDPEEYGWKIPTVRSLERIAHALGVLVAVLLRLAGQ
jgi:hypothetical protein